MKTNQGQIQWLMLNFITFFSAALNVFIFLLYGSITLMLYLKEGKWLLIDFSPLMNALWAFLNIILAVQILRVKLRLTRIIFFCNPVFCLIAIIQYFQMQAKFGWLTPYPWLLVSTALVFLYSSIHMIMAWQLRKRCLILESQPDPKLVVPSLQEEK